MNRSTHSGFGPTLLFAALALLCGPVAAQTSAPPPPSMAPVAPSKAQARPSKPRPAIQLSPAERQAIDAAEENKVRAAGEADAGLAPTASDIKPRTEPDSGTTRIQQIYTSNRVSEVIVTPPGQTYSYIMVNREGRQPYGTTELNSGLSVPMFFRFEFGKSTPNTPVSPPPASSPSR